MSDAEFDTLPMDDRGNSSLNVTIPHPTILN